MSDKKDSNTGITYQGIPVHSEKSNSVSEHTKYVGKPVPVNEEIHLPNVPLVKIKLSDDIMDYLWKRIEVAAEDQHDANGHLAGNISKSLYLTDKDEYFYKNVLEVVCYDYYLKYHMSIPCFRNSFSNKESPKGMAIKNFWVNSQRKNEFNPLHDHGGVMSFVIWMKIPTRSEDQHALPIVSNSNTPSASDFQMTYTNIFGGICSVNLAMDPEVEGSMLLFPSTMMHQVYPFYECDDDRISISGNLYYKL